MEYDMLISEDGSAIRIYKHDCGRETCRPCRENNLRALVFNNPEYENWMLVSIVEAQEAPQEAIKVLMSDDGCQVLTKLQIIIGAPWETIEVDPAATAQAMKVSKLLLLESNRIEELIQLSNDELVEERRKSDEKADQFIEKFLSELQGKLANPFYSPN